LNQRFYSLDVFRGATVCLMILVNNPGSWGHIFDPLEHAKWHGLTPTDLVFPFFLFAVGNAMAFVMPKLEAAGEGVFWRKVIKRTLLIFAIGLFLTWYPFITDVNRLAEGSVDKFERVTIFKGFTWTDLSRNKDGDIIETVKGIRILGVLARIALCYFFASVLIHYLKPKKALYTGIICLFVYWILFYVFGEQNDWFSITGWFGNDVDKAILGESHMYHGELVNGKPYTFDPEGIASTLPAIVQVIFGYMIGQYIIKRGKTPEMLNGLFAAGVGMLVIGFCWDTVFPINKKIWTSSYTIYTTGLATITIATMIYLIEFRNYKGWPTKFFDVFGKNALFVFALSSFLPKTLALIRIPNGLNDKGETIYTDPWRWLYSNVLKFIPEKVGHIRIDFWFIDIDFTIPPEIPSLIYALCVITLMWAICYWMDKKKIYVKV
jgi:predicted acyltransferase